MAGPPGPSRRVICSRACLGRSAAVLARALLKKKDIFAEEYTLFGGLLRGVPRASGRYASSRGCQGVLAVALGRALQCHYLAQNQESRVKAEHQGIMKSDWLLVIELCLTCDNAGMLEVVVCVWCLTFDVRARLPGRVRRRGGVPWRGSRWRDAPEGTSKWCAQHTVSMVRSKHR